MNGALAALQLYADQLRGWPQMRVSDDWPFCRRSPVGIIGRLSWRLCLLSPLRTFRSAGHLDSHMQAARSRAGANGATFQARVTPCDRGCNGEPSSGGFPQSQIHFATWSRSPVACSLIRNTVVYQTSRLVELRGIEPLTSAVRLQRSPN